MKFSVESLPAERRRQSRVGITNLPAGPRFFSRIVTIRLSLVNLLRAVPMPTQWAKVRRSSKTRSGVVVTSMVME